MCAEQELIFAFSLRVFAEAGLAPAAMFPPRVRFGQR